MRAVCWDEFSREIDHLKLLACSRRLGSYTVEPGVASTCIAFQMSDASVAASSEPCACHCRRMCSTCTQLFGRWTSHSAVHAHQYNDAKDEKATSLLESALDCLMPPSAVLVCASVVLVCAPAAVT